MPEMNYMNKNKKGNGPKKNMKLHTASGSYMPMYGGESPMGSSMKGSNEGSNATAKQAKAEKNRAEAVSKPPKGMSSGSGKPMMNKNMAGAGPQQKMVDKLQSSQVAKHKSKAMQSKGAESPKAKLQTKTAKKERSFAEDTYF